jgi:hypothetical protein
VLVRKLMRFQGVYRVRNVLHHACCVVSRRHFLVSKNAAETLFEEGQRLHTAIRFRLSKSLFPDSGAAVAAATDKGAASAKTIILAHLAPAAAFASFTSAGCNCDIGRHARRHLLLLLLTAVFIATLFATADCKKSGRKKSKANHGSVQPGDMSVANSLFERAMKLKQGGAVVPGH